MGRSPVGELFCMGIRDYVELLENSYF
eukprot:SAG25_NODE_6792_length_529_cov_1.411628_1_plen_26_part_01